MKQTLKWILPVSLIIFLEVIKTIPNLIEVYYAQGIYPYIGQALRFVLGWIPFSAGDLTIAMLTGWAIYTFFQIFKGGKRQPIKKGLLAFGKTVVFWGLWAYVAFYALWGLNYYRLGSSYLMEIEMDSYSTQDVDTLVQCLQQKIVSITKVDSLAINQAKTNNRLSLRDEGMEAYRLASFRYPFMHFKRASLKPNLLGPLQSYTGYAGYLFPLTGEAHVNFYGPTFTMPFTVCHEMAHQLGFGTESEANLVGFLAARESANKAFVYSAYAGVHQYALSELFVRDSLLAKNYIDSLPPYFKRDKLELRKFVADHQSFMQPVLNVVYNLYLLGNNQPEGLESYNYVVAWLIAYGKKFGWNSL
jgi:hypothetical protein